MQHLPLELEHTPNRSGFSLWLLWLLATATGGSVHVFLYSGQDAPLPEFYVAWFVVVPLGLTQAMVLRFLKIGSTWSWGNSSKWVLATEVGWLAGIIAFFSGVTLYIWPLVMIDLHTSADMSLELWDIIAFGGRAICAVLGACVFGFSQWRILRKYVPNSDWWIPINGVAWVFSEMMGNFVSDLIPYHFIDYGGFEEISYSVNPTLVMVLVASTMFGVITATGLVWILKKPPKGEFLAYVFRIVNHLRMRVARRVARNATLE